VGGGDDGEVDVIVALELRGRDDDLGRFRVAGGREGGKEGRRGGRCMRRNAEGGLSRSFPFPFIVPSLLPFLLFSRI
jgi:hypothetical protein